MRANWILRLSAVVVVAVIFVAISGALAGTPTSLDPQPMFVIDPDPMIVVGPGGAGGITNCGKTRPVSGLRSSSAAAPRWPGATSTPR